MWEITKYDKSCRLDWNKFVREARNATFLFLREYMDYHSDRFADCSLMAFRNGKLSAILPANLSENTLFSHQGLTYGGWVLPVAGIDGADYEELWKAWFKWCRGNGIDLIDYKPLPSIYHRMPSQEDIFMLSRYGEMTGCGLSSAINLHDNPGFNKLQKRHLKHLPDNVCIRSFNGNAEEETRNFHTLLSECLHSRHNVLPVHSFEELLNLMALFPDNIRIWEASEGEETRAAICAYMAPPCFHCQYIATSEEGRRQNILPFLVSKMIDEATRQGFLFFDFGISTENNGAKLNYGLNRQKTSFGASGVAYSRWRIKLS